MKGERFSSAGTVVCQSGVSGGGAGAVPTDCGLKACIGSDHCLVIRSTGQVGRKKRKNKNRKKEEGEGERRGKKGKKG